MGNATILLPLQLDADERPHWESADGKRLLRHLNTGLQQFGLARDVLAVGPACCVDVLAKQLDVPVQLTPPAPASDHALLPPGSQAALRVLESRTGDPESLAAIVDFRAPFLSAETIASALKDAARDGHARIAVVQSPHNTVNLACPREVLATGLVALRDEPCPPIAPPAHLADVVGSGVVSRPFHFDAKALNWTQYPMGDDPWRVIVSTWYLTASMPEIISASRLAATNYADATVHGVFYQENDRLARRLLPSPALSGEGEFLGMDSLWNIQECLAVCLRRKGKNEVWFHASLALPGALLHLWRYSSAREASGADPLIPYGNKPIPVQDAARTMLVAGRTFVGPVAEIADLEDAFVWRLARPALSNEADYLEPITLRRELWGFDPATGLKTDPATGAPITGRQRYPENLTPTGALCVGSVAALRQAKALLRAGGLKSIRLANDEAVSVTDRPSLFRALHVLDSRDAARLASVEKGSAQAAPR